MTACRWFREGELPEPAVSGRVVAYARVSSADQRDDVERQAGRVVTGAAGQGLSVDQVVCEIGSGMNGHRQQADPRVVDTRRLVCWS